MIFQIFGQITPPYSGSYSSGGGYGSYAGIILFLNNVLKLIFVVGGILVLFNLIFAGFQFLNAGGDPKKIEEAWNKIWQSLVGILIMVASFVIAALIGVILFGKPQAILWPAIYGPK